MKVYIVLQEQGEGKDYAKEVLVVLLDEAKADYILACLNDYLERMLAESKTVEQPSTLNRQGRNREIMNQHADIISRYGFDRGDYYGYLAYSTTYSIECVDLIN